MPPGTVGEDISLSISPESSYFSLSSKRLVLTRPLDRDEADLSSVSVSVTCTATKTGRRKTVPVVVTIADVNDNAPAFQGEPYLIEVQEVREMYNKTNVLPHSSITLIIYFY